MNRITLYHNNNKIDEIELTHGELTIGRDSKSDLHIDDPYLSWNHAKIVTLLDVSHVEDLGSTNGTFVNGEKSSQHTLHQGDIITLGDYQIRFETDKQQESVDEAMPTMQLDRDQLMRMLEEQQAATTQQSTQTTKEHSRTLENKQEPARRTAPNLEQLEAIRDASVRTGQQTSAHKPATATPKTAQTDGTPRPRYRDKYAHLFEEPKPKKKPLLSPVTVYIITVATICIIALLLLPYIPT